MRRDVVVILASLAACGEPEGSCAGVCEAIATGVVDKLSCFCDVPQLPAPEVDAGIADAGRPDASSP